MALGKCLVCSFFVPKFRWAIFWLFGLLLFEAKWFFLPKIGIYLIIKLIFNFRFGSSMCSNFYCDDWFWTLRTLRAIHLTLQSNRDWKWCQSKWFRTSGWNQESETDAFLTVLSIFYAFFMLYLSWNSVSLSSILNVVVSGSVNLAHIIWRLYYGHFLHF